MSYSNQTEHYGLPLPTGSDKSSWLDTNEAFRAIDSELYRAAQSSGGSTEAIEELQQGQATLTERITQANANLTQEIADRSAGDATLTSRIATAEQSINTNHTDIQTALEEIHTLINTVNAELDDIRYQSFDLVVHSNLSKAGVYHNISSAKINISMQHVTFPNMSFRNNTDAAISFTGGVALSTGDYLVPLFTISASQANAASPNIWEGMELLAPYTLTRGSRHAYPASGTDRHFVSHSSIRAARQSSGQIVIGFVEETATYSLPARTAWYIEQGVSTHSFGHLPEDIEE